MIHWVIKGQETGFRPRGDGRLARRETADGFEGDADVNKLFVRATKLHAHPSKRNQTFVRATKIQSIRPNKIEHSSRRNPPERTTKKQVGWPQSSTHEKKYQFKLKLMLETITLLDELCVCLRCVVCSLKFLKEMKVNVKLKCVEN